MMTLSDATGRRRRGAVRGEQGCKLHHKLYVTVDLLPSSRHHVRKEEGLIFLSVLILEIYIKEMHIDIVL